MKSHYLLSFLILISSSVVGQQKVWKKSGWPPIKVKGFELVLDTLPGTSVQLMAKAKSQAEELNEANKDKAESAKVTAAAIIPSITLTGFLIPNLLSYGSAVAQMATKIDEKKYVAEFSSDYALKFKGDFSDSYMGSGFMSTLWYYPKGEDEPKKSAEYTFSVESQNGKLRITLDSTPQESPLPIKSKPNYDFFVTKIEITAVALVTVKDTSKNNYTYEEEKVLGTNAIIRTHTSFRSGTTSKSNRNYTSFKLPKPTKPELRYKIKEVGLAVKISYANPHGLSTSDLHSFLEDFSDLNVATGTTLLLGE